MLIGILETAGGQQLIALLRRLVAVSAERLSVVERKVLALEITSILSALDHAGENDAETVCAGVGDLYIGFRGGVLHRDMASQGLLQDAAAQTRPLGRSKEEIAAAKEAQRATAEAKRCREQLESMVGETAALRAEVGASARARAEAERALQEEIISFAKQKESLQGEVRGLSRQVEFLTVQADRLRQGHDAATDELARAKAELKETTDRLSSELDEQRRVTAEAEAGWAAATNAAKEAARFASEAARAAASIRSGMAPRRQVAPTAKLAVPLLPGFGKAEAIDSPTASETGRKSGAGPGRAGEGSFLKSERVKSPGDAGREGQPSGAEGLGAMGSFFQGASEEHALSSKGHALAQLEGAASEEEQPAKAPLTTVYKPPTIDDDKDEEEQGEGEGEGEGEEKEKEEVPAPAAVGRAKPRRKKKGEWRRAVAVKVDDGLEEEEGDDDVWPALEFVDEKSERETAVASRERGKGAAGMGEGEEEEGEGEGESEYEEDEGSEEYEEGSAEEEGKASGQEEYE
jgi:outer membrane murein-binding lipoprotein Lpp